MQIYECIFTICQAAEESSPSSSGRMATRNSPRKGPPQPLTNITPTTSRRQKNAPKALDALDTAQLGKNQYYVQMIFLYLRIKYIRFKQYSDSELLLFPKKMI